MKPISIKLTKISKVKETPEERKERLKYWRCTTTRIKQSKKIYNRKKVNKTIDSLWQILYNISVKNKKGGNNNAYQQV